MLRSTGEIVTCRSGCFCPPHSIHGVAKWASATGDAAADHTEVRLLLVSLAPSLKGRNSQPRGLLGGLGPGCGVLGGLSSFVGAPRARAGGALLQGPAWGQVCSRQRPQPCSPRGWRGASAVPRLLTPEPRRLPALERGHCCAFNYCLPPEDLPHPETLLPRIRMSLYRERQPRCDLVTGKLAAYLLLFLKCICSGHVFSKNE